MDASAWRQGTLAELRRAWPYALVLALALGATVGVGAHLSNATPSETRPHGWPGPATFENGVAMVRGDLVLAVALPALALGATALRGRSPSDHRVGLLPPLVAVDALLLVAAAFAAGGLGAWIAARTPVEAYVAFCTVHALLALAFYSLALLVASLAGRHALPVALAVWGSFELLYDKVVKVVLFRTVGAEVLTSGFPTWFYVAQALSPLSAYRGALITWRKGFRDYVERLALDGAALPPWVGPELFVGLLLGLWVALPLGLAHLAWWTRGRLASWRAGRTARRPEPA